jgi:hypothetical protein
MQRVVDDCLALDSNRLARMGVFSEGRLSGVNPDQRALISSSRCLRNSL